MRARGFVFRVVLAVSALLSPLLPAVSLPASQGHAATLLDITQYRLDNGLQVILVRDDAAPTIGVTVWYKVGAGDDPQGRNGFAHLFEHLMFQGSAHVSRGYFDRFLESTGGTDNAWTDLDQTAYHEQLAAHQLPLALWLEADRMGSLVIDQANFNREREVVKEEYRQSYENAPYGQAWLKLETMAFDYLPYQRPVIGNVADLDRAQLDDVRQFHQTYYKPNNAVLAIAGDLDVNQTRELVQRYFGPIPRQDDPPARPSYTFTPQLQAQEITLTDRLANVPATLVSYRIPPRGQPGHYAAALLARVLGMGDSSRLARALIDTGLATYAHAYVTGYQGPSRIDVFLEPNPDVDVARLEKAYEGELARIRTEGVTADELAKAVNQLRAGQIRNLERAQDLAMSIQEAYFYLGDPQAVFTELDRYQAVTPADVRRVATEVFSDGARNVIRVVLPEKKEATPGAETPEATPVATGGEVTTAVELTTTQVITPPAPLPVKPFTLPQITDTRLDNGLRVMVIPRPNLPLLTMQLVLPGGASAAPAELPGLAELTAETLTRGTTTRSAQDIAGQAEQVGGNLSASADNDTLTLSAGFLIENTALAFTLLGDVALNPTFPADEVDTRRQNLLTALQNDLSDAGTVADKAFAGVVYGPHPYGRSASSESLSAITRGDVEAFYRAQRNPRDALLVIAGDIAPEEALTQARLAFGGWKAPGEAVAVSYPAPPVPQKLHIDLVDRPGSTQADLRVGNLTPPGNSPDRYALGMVNQVLGAEYTSRLSLNLREQRGFTYGAYSSLTFPRDRGAFVVRTAVRNEVVEPALREILAEIERLRATPVPADELQRMKAFLIGSFPLRLETGEDLIGSVVALQTRGLPLADLSVYPGRIEAIDAAAVLHAAGQYLRSQEAVIVVAGDATTIRPALEKIAPVTLIDAYGHAAPPASTGRY